MGWGEVRCVLLSVCVWRVWDIPVVVIVSCAHTFQPELCVSSSLLHSSAAPFDIFTPFGPEPELLYWTPFTVR